MLSRTVSWGSADWRSPWQARNVSGISPATSWHRDLEEGYFSYWLTAHPLLFFVFNGSEQHFTSVIYKITEVNYASLPLRRSIGTKGSEVAMLRPEAKQWPSVGFETLPWHHDPEALAGISKTARRRIGSTYRAAVPFEIASRPLKIGETVAHRLAEVSVELARFDAEQDDMSRT